VTTAERQRRWREKQRRRAKRVAGRDARELTRTFATAALDWSRAQEGSVARGLGLRVAALLDATEEGEDAGTAALRRLAAAMGIDVTDREDDAQRATAFDMLDASVEELQDGTATLASVRSGLQAAKALQRTRPRVNTARLDRTIQLALLGIYTDAHGVEHRHTEAPPWACCPGSRSLGEGRR